LHHKIAELCQQNDDLESTLVMIRNSWNQTGNVMENQVNICNNKIERLTKELHEYQQKYENMQPEFEMQEQMIESLQQQRIQMDTELSNLELKEASQSVEITRLKTELQQSQARFEKVRSWVLSLLQQGIIEIDSQDDSKNDVVKDIFQNGSLENFILNNFNEASEQYQIHKSANENGIVDSNTYLDNTRSRPDLNNKLIENGMNGSNENGNNQAQFQPQQVMYAMGHKSRESVQDVKVDGMPSTPASQLDEFEFSGDDADLNVVAGKNEIKLVD